MDPDLFVTIAFSSFVFVAGMVGLILMTVMVVRSHRQAEGPYEQEWPRQPMPSRPGARRSRSPHRPDRCRP